MRAYPKYKASGVQWLGEIPNEWNRNRIKFCFNSINGGVWGEEPLGDSNDIVCIRVADFDYKHGVIDTTNFTTRNISISEQKSRLLKKGDLLIEKSGGGELSPVGRVVKFDLDIKAVCSNFINRLNTKKQVSSDFLNYLNRHLYSKGITESCINQTTGIQNLKVGEFVSSVIFTPSLPEQRSIVHFLDYKTRQIDSFIDNRQKQIELLREQLQFKINQAITSGINSKIKFKNTDIKYVPKIPEHWDIRKFKSLTSILTCGVASTPEYVEENEGVAFLSAQNCRPFAMDLSKYNYIKPALHKQLTRYKKPKKGDVLVTRVGAGIGQACIIDTDLEFSVYVSLTHIRPNKEILSEYIVYFFNTEYCYQLNREGTVVAGGQGNLNVKNVERYRIPLPSIEEQKEIIKYLDNYRVEMDTLISKYQKQIDLMQEYRTSLISQAVTGKIDVREWQPKKKKTK